jgi:hypothetical protein
MKNRLIISLMILAAAGVSAQEKDISKPSGDGGQAVTEQSAKQPEYRSARTQTLSTMVAYGSFSIGGEDRFGPMFILQYSPTRSSFPAVDFFGGVLLQTGNSSEKIDGQGSIPLASYYVPYYSPYSNYRNDNYYRLPNFRLGLGFVGADVTFYMLEGEVRPYVGFGGSLALWTYSSRLSSSVAPDVKGGLNVHLSNSFSGFAEVRHMFGVPNLLDLSSPKFDGLTSAAIGLSFAPRLR